MARKVIRLVSVYKTRAAEDVLYKLLEERTPDQCISHQVMPTKAAHHEFVLKMPYHAWFLIQDDAQNGLIVGSIYLTKAAEIGVFVFKQHWGQGYARQAIAEMRKRFPGRKLANVSPQNKRSMEFFEKLGGRQIQVTYELT
jgi:RimJ/RimL family protein N-acetyltransferase